MAEKDLRIASRINWTRNVPEGQNLGVDDIKLGCLLRIADAAELMAKRHEELVRDRDFWKNRADSLIAENICLINQRTALRGVVTKLKKAGGRGDD